ncbi:p-hydroxyphenylacetate 3-hydroxylase reductase component [Oceanospirillum linum]|uniref:Flavin oxidoreductase n=1 Tax=Oceanospirillum linum TaxID=966 RepID=A0A1T1HEQ3_OCELI|nr:flavin reductase [Oceanospirillum linum]OOV88197.1 flavin oxidoreductase [Oceanospirillum linum]SEF47350.1 NADH-FMN oxidoreductase RutF, flavin reductase (DIM6/NTAB) family [Oleiphilus messinensis]SMP02405.1 NADH-FMN oxidoreductase RutF, flavin reductase (DIM6/NTAB) family [Oceanospirillum linum]
MSTEFDPRDFRRALGNFATGVTVITACTPEGVQTGVTANSFNSVSLEPPLVLWSIMKNSGSVEVFDNASHFAVNILAADQIPVSNHFARPSDDKFADIEYEKGLGDAPLLPDCSARFQCESYQKLDGGDHWILVGKVVAYDDYGRAPLLYHGGAYSAVIPHAGAKPKDSEATDAGQEKNDKRLASNLYYQMLQAVKRYQSGYQPLQLATGLRTIEARMLLTLNDFGSLATQDLEERIGMPDNDLHGAVETLCRKGWLTQQGGQLSLTSAGAEQAETLWRVASERQDEVFGQFSEEELATFRKVLEAV